LRNTDVEEYGREPDRPQMTMWYAACGKTKATGTRSEYVILSTFPLQQWLLERASLLGHTYINSVVLTLTGA